MNSGEIRQTFLVFFRSKGHYIVPSAPMVIKDDPSLMFTNAGMNQFKDIFLGLARTPHKRVANTQKCLRVSGKHNDLEEVGIDTYHHTMFEMLGNWSFGDYFKKEAIAWAWELLTAVFNIDKENLYVTVFAGDEDEGLPRDTEAYNEWRRVVPEDRILFGTKKDNFWEMGDTGPCGPCSEIHVDVRSMQEKRSVDGASLINKGHPLVIEIWNLVFIEYNRNSNGHLSPLPQKHIDTGMGFERLCMVLQGKQSNYDTDIFSPVIATLSGITGIRYGAAVSTDIAMRVVADHLRAVTFAIADGQLPSNTGAGYVIRRILRRAVRYGYTFLDRKEPFMNDLVPHLVELYKDVFPEVARQHELIRKVIAEEESSFLHTLAFGIRRFEQYTGNSAVKQLIDGDFAFELFDTYGFPVDLTQLMAREKGYEVDMDGFRKNLDRQKERSRQHAAVDADDWIILTAGEHSEFIGYDTLEADVRLTRYRQVKIKGEEKYQLVFDKTPFYAESGGQVGDTGFIEDGSEKIAITDTKKEHNLIMHLTARMPSHPGAVFRAWVDAVNRLRTACNHSATHLLHHALREILGKHVEQKGSYVGPTHLRFDFSHYQKVSPEDLTRIEAMVNSEIRKDIPLVEQRSVPIDDAIGAGAIAFFGEKYGDKVRVIRFDDSLELCGGTHVRATGQIGCFRILSETAIAAGVRRIEAITADAAEAFVNEHILTLEAIKKMLKNPGDVVRSVEALLAQNAELHHKIEELSKDKLRQILTQLTGRVEDIHGMRFIGQRLDLDPGELKDLAFDLNAAFDELFLILGSESDGKANLIIMISESLAKKKKLHAGSIIRDVAHYIEGGGGGQAHYASAGGRKPAGLSQAIDHVRKMLLNSA